VGNVSDVALLRKKWHGRGASHPCVDDWQRLTFFQMNADNARGLPLPKSSSHVAV